MALITIVIFCESLLSTADFVVPILCQKIKTLYFDLSKEVPSIEIDSTEGLQY